MKLLFLHQNFPGQYLHILRRHIREGVHDLLFLSQPNTNSLAGVRKMEYPLVRAPLKQADPLLHDFDLAMLRAQSVAARARELVKLGYEPDVILGHNGWGELLHLREVWPRVPIVPYFEFYYHTSGLDVDFDPEFPMDADKRSQVRIRNATNLLGLELATLGQVPTRFQGSTYPSWAQPKLRHVPEGVDLDLCRPDPGAEFAIGERRWRKGSGRRLVTYVSRNLEPYRGTHIVIRALPKLLAACPDVDMVLVGGDSVSYGAAPAGGGGWKDRFLAELDAPLDPERVFFPGKVPYESFRAMLQASSLHLYLTYPFVASWSLREALASGCTILGSDVGPVQEFVTHGETGMLFPFLRHDLLAEAAIDLLADPAQAARLGARAREWAEAHLTLDETHRTMDAVMEEAIALEVSAGQGFPARRRSAKRRVGTRSSAG